MTEQNPSQRGKPGVGWMPEDGQYIEYTAENMPYHLRTAAAGTKCSKCSRTTWAEAEFNRECQMPQPNGTVCDGSFGYPVDLPPEGSPTKRER